MANLDKAEIGKNIQIFLNEMKKFERFAKLEGIKGTKSSAGRTVEGSKKILKLFFPFAGDVIIKTTLGEHIEIDFFEKYKKSLRDVIEVNYDLNVSNLLKAVNKIEELHSTKNYNWFKASPKKDFF